ncbi:hypothetical protein Y1Q_0015622 [Alligator mississippiensis]|uniref:Uncharacterized protein n=1 Tax=Alligator mississippiensis TaxID=8496 RepID=A0A151NNZ6_ALLMI|nr:hypothetical protein Y1Q_0015622 [Alligator mississippiensis]
MFTFPKSYTFPLDDISFDYSLTLEQPAEKRTVDHPSPAAGKNLLNAMGAHSWVEFPPVKSPRFFCSPVEVTEA